MSQAIPLGFAMERLCYAMRSIIKLLYDSLVVRFRIGISFKGVILSVRRIWRGADRYMVSAFVPLHARSFGTEVPQDDALDRDFSNRTITFCSILAQCCTEKSS